MTKDVEATVAPGTRDPVSEPVPNTLSPSRRRRVLTVTGVIAVVVLGTGLASAYRYQPLLQTRQGEFGSYVVAWNSSKVDHTTINAISQSSSAVPGPVIDVIWTEPTGAYNVEVVATINNSGSHAVTIEGLEAPAPGVPKSHLTVFFHKPGSYGSEGGAPFHPFTLAAHSSKTLVVDYTQICSPSSAGASYLSYTQMPVTFSFLGFHHTVGVPIDPYEIKRRLSC